jgi:hypothetical protein
MSSGRLAGFNRPSITGLIRPVSTKRDLDEKGAQVQMMGETFGRAAHVLACVSPHGDGSCHVMKMLAACQSLNPDASRWKLSPWFNKETRSFDTLVLLLRLTMIFGTCHLRRFYFAVQSFFARPYFERAWVVQEIFNRYKETSLCCGTDVQPLSSLITLWEFRVYFREISERWVDNIPLQISMLQPRGFMRWLLQQMCRNKIMASEQYAASLEPEEERHIGHLLFFSATERGV